MRSCGFQLWKKEEKKLGEGQQQPRRTRARKKARAEFSYLACAAAMKLSIVVSKARSTGAVATNCTNSWGNVLDLNYDFHLGDDNGNVWAITNYRDQTRNQSFTYDALNRLTSAQNAGTDCTKMTVNGKTEYWGNSYGYDPWGNLITKTPTKCSAENLNEAAWTSNQLHTISGADNTYDAAGNMTHDATTGNNYNYDAENRIIGAAGYTYIYDADGNRVEKSNGSTGTIYWYMSPGIVAESDLAGNPKSEYVFFAGERVARKDFPGNTVSYYFSDHLKTASVITDSAGNIKEDVDYYPWGGELQLVNNDSNHYKFTGKERDAETGLDYFGARYYGNALGRWMSPDWAEKATAVPYANFGNPQSLNLYSYVRNNPTTLGDPDGHCFEDACILEGIAVGWGIKVIGGAALVGVGMAIGWAWDKVTGHNSDNQTPSPPPPPSTPSQTGAHSTPAQPPTPEQGHNAKGKRDPNNPHRGASKMKPKSGSKGGPGAGKDFSAKTQQEGLTENQAANDGQARCVFCGDAVGEGTGNKINYDHAISKAEDGNNTLDNLNVACEYCNKSKGAGTEPKNPKYPQQQRQ
jgi:RHS repeat-associated protein